MERGHCSGQVEGKGPGSPKVTFEQSPEGSKGKQLMADQGCSSVGRYRSHLKP